MKGFELNSLNLELIYFNYTYKLWVVDIIFTFSFWFGKNNFNVYLPENFFMGQVLFSSACMCMSVFLCVCLWVFISVIPKRLIQNELGRMMFNYKIQVSFKDETNKSGITHTLCLFIWIFKYLTKVLVEFLKTSKSQSFLSFNITKVLKAYISFNLLHSRKYYYATRKWHCVKSTWHFFLNFDMLLSFWSCIF